MFEGSIKIIPIGKNAAFQEAFDIKVGCCGCVLWLRAVHVCCDYVL